MATVLPGPRNPENHIRKNAKSAAQNVPKFPTIAKKSPQTDKKCPEPFPLHPTATRLFHRAVKREQARRLTSTPFTGYMLPELRLKAFQRRVFGSKCIDRRHNRPVEEPGEFL